MMLDFFNRFKYKNFLFILFVFSGTAIYYVSKSYVVDTVLSEWVELRYAQFLIFILNFLVQNSPFSIENQAIVFNQFAFNFSSILVIKYYFIAFLILFVFPKQILKTSIVFSFVSLGFLSSVVFAVLGDIYIEGYFSVLVHPFVLSFRYLLLLLLIMYKFNLHHYTRTLFNTFNERVSQSFNINFSQLLFIVASIHVFSAVFDFILMAEWNYLVKAMTLTILEMSNALLWILGYAETYVDGKYIWLNNYWLFLDFSCLGMGIISVFITFIMLIKSRLINRIAYVFIGLILILLMNALRIVLILKHIYENQTPQHAIEDYHTISTNYFYVAVFGMILIYIKWFQNVDIFSKKITK